MNRTLPIAVLVVRNGEHFEVYDIRKKSFKNRGGGECAPNMFRKINTFNQGKLYVRPQSYISYKLLKENIHRVHAICHPKHRVGSFYFFNVQVNFCMTIKHYSNIRR